MRLRRLFFCVSILMVFFACHAQMRRPTDSLRVQAMIRAGHKTQEAVRQQKLAAAFATYEPQQSSVFWKDPLERSNNIAFCIY